MSRADEVSLGPLQSSCCSFFSTPVCYLRLEDRDRLPTPPRHHFIIYSPGSIIARPLLKALYARSCAFPILYPLTPAPTNKRYVKYPSTFQSLTIFSSPSPSFSFSPLCVHRFLSSLVFFHPFLLVMLFIVIPGLSFCPSLLSGLFPVFVLHLPPHLLMFVNYVSK